MGSDLGAVLNQDAGVIHAIPIPLYHSLHTLSLHARTLTIWIVPGFYS